MTSPEAKPREAGTGRFVRSAMRQWSRTKREQQRKSAPRIQPGCFTVPEAAIYLGISTRTLLRIIEAGDVKTFHLPGIRHRRLSKVYLDQWMCERTAVEASRKRDRQRADR